MQTIVGNMWKKCSTSPSTVCGSLAAGVESFLPHEHFPWFREARIREILSVELRHGQHLYWPEPDADLHIARLANVEHYPLVARSLPRPCARMSAVRMQVLSSIPGRNQPLRVA